MTRIPGESMVDIEEIIERFASARPFEHAGEPPGDDRVRPVRDWKEAIRRRTSGPGEEIYDRILNRIRTFARTTRGEEWFNAEWSGLIQSLKPRIARQLEPVVAPLLRNVKGGNIVEAHFYSDVMETWLIAEFPDPASRPWLDWHMQWYKAGHFPAGWQGRLPSENHADPDRLPELFRDGVLYVY